MKFTFGSDPEFMLVDASGSHKSAIGVVPGTKEKKHNIGGCSFYYDNVLAECNVPPSGGKDLTIQNVKKSLSLLSEIIRPHGLRLTIQAGQRYPTKELQHPDAFIVGCKEESCAYRLGNIDPDEVRGKIKQDALRTAGGHIHLGTYLGKLFDPCVMLVRMLDLFVGIPSLFMDHDHTSILRRKLYGEAGRYRQPKHGVEYRSLGNFWLGSPDLVGLIHDLCSFSIQFIEQGRHNDFWEVDEEMLDSDEFWNSSDPDPAKCHVCHGYDAAKLRKCFTTGNLNNARSFLQFAFEHLPTDLTSKIEKEMIPRSTNLYDNWGLKT